MSLQRPAIDPYRVLSIPRTSEVEVIREAYLALAWRHHPDHGGSPERMVEINWAWNQIRDELGILKGRH
jgi:curved DNA-binding protein CbpA